MFSLVQLLSCVRLFGTAAHQASLSITNSRSLMSITSVMPSNHLILCRPLLLPPSVFPSIRVFSNEQLPVGISSLQCNCQIRKIWFQYSHFPFPGKGTRKTHTHSINQGDTGLMECPCSHEVPQSWRPCFIREDPVCPTRSFEKGIFKKGTAVWGRRSSAEEGLQ